jgi:hypothetical protein
MQVNVMLCPVWLLVSRYRTVTSLRLTWEFEIFRGFLLRRFASPVPLTVLHDAFASARPTARLNESCSSTCKCEY